MFVLTLVQSRTHRHCSERFTHYNQLKVHLLESHNEGTWFTCHICQKKFSRSRDLMIHIRRHEGVKPCVCCECPKRFCTSSELKRHQLVHSDIRGFACRFCAKSFKRKAAVLIHVKTCVSAYNFDLSNI